MIIACSRTILFAYGDEGKAPCCRRLCCLSERSIQDQQSQALNQHDGSHARDGKHHGFLGFVVICKSRGLHGNYRLGGCRDPGTLGLEEGVRGATESNLVMQTVECGSRR